LQQFLTAKDLEAILRIDVKTIYAYVQKGLIPYVKIQSNVRFSIREILDWIEKQSYRPHQARNK
jgi:predicted DNA-binding transcriptional regulator AlpA